MEKDQNINIGSQDTEVKEADAEEQNNEVYQDASKKNEEVKEITPEEEVKEITPEEEVKELKDKVARTFAEMENQRRRFEKEKEDAFDYGGFAFAKETLNLIDNLERSKQILENDEVLKNTEALKKTLDHFDIISKDMISILSKNGITSVDSVGKKIRS
jgi:molecular chaperone GrpE